MNARRTREAVFLRWLPLIIISIFVLLPIYWAIATSLKTDAGILQRPVQYIPNPFTLENYSEAWVASNFSLYFLNSLKVSLASVFFICVIAIMAGYALARYKFKGKILFMGMVLCIQFIPHAVLLIPLFDTFNKVGLVGTLTSVALVCITLNFPFLTVLMRGFITGIPYSLEEAAQIDGCSRFGGVVRIVIPMLVPGIVTCGAFSFIGIWNEFLFSLMFLSDASKYTIPIGLRMMQGEYNVEYGALAAGAIIAMSIPVLLFAYLQKYLVNGLGGAVKG